MPDGRASLAVLFLALVLSGCAAAPPVRPPAAAPARPPPPPPRQYARVFPDFAAVIVRPEDSLASLAGKYLGDPSLDWYIAEFNEVDRLTPGMEVVIPPAVDNPGGLSPEGYRTVPVLAYHKFSKSAGDMMTVRESDFDAQMRFLKVNGYRVLSIDELLGFLDYRRPVPRKAVVITIDDGWRSTYDIAFPILKKYGYAATLFVYTDLIVSSEKTLGWDLVAELQRGGIDIQCHTKTHRYLGRRDGGETYREYFESVRTELGESARVIRRRLNKDVKYLAYPYGDVSPLVVAFMKKLGYRAGFTVDRGANPFFADRYRIKRSMIYGTFSLKDFENSLAVAGDEALR